MAKSFATGKYECINPEKYLGDVNNITYRSSWELYFNEYVDNSTHVKFWVSEGIEIHYYHPFYKEMRRYYPDYFVVYVDQYGNEHKEIIEVKPENQIFISKRASKDQQITHAINLAKWDACKKYCDKNNIVFRLCSEEQLFKK